MAIAQPPTKVETLQPQIDEAPARKPSQIIREWPDEEWCPNMTRQEAVLPDGHVVTQHCDFGILLRVAGYYDPSSPSFHGSPSLLMVERFGISHDLLSDLIQANNTGGKDAGADLLEAHGF